MGAATKRAAGFVETKPGTERSPYGERLVYDRRSAPRTAIEGKAMAAFTDPSGGVAIAAVELVDESAGGIGFACEIDVRPGSSVTLYNLPRSTSERGTVVRVARSNGVTLVGCLMEGARVAA